MDYKKSKAPTNTVTHNLMDFCEGTDNIYESVVIMSKRANQIGVQMKENLQRNSRNLLLLTITLKKLSRIVSKLRFHVIMKSCLNLR